VRGQPARELQLLDALADHDEEHEAEQDPGRDEHAPVGEPALEHERGQPDGGRQREADADALEHRARAPLEAEVLQEEHHLEALSVDGGEAEQGEPEQRAAADASAPADERTAATSDHAPRRRTSLRLAGSSAVGTGM
jgi:hypothetical protein